MRLHPLAKKPNLDFEVQFGFPRLTIVGVDEVGRGCLAGPVVAGAVVLPPSVLDQPPEWLGQVADSKLLTPDKREFLNPLIADWVLDSALGVASVEEIDRINIYHASHLAMVRAVQGLKRVKPQHVLIDGNKVPRDLKISSSAIVKGDMKCLTIACASILAKVWRDRLMVELDQQYPGYGLGGHKGYSTPVHQRALQELGATPIHRRSFGPVAAVLGSYLNN